MNRIVFSFFIFAFVQLVNSQTACTNATVALAANIGCTATFTTGRDASVLCIGTCRDLFNDIVDNCAAAVSSYS